MRQYLDDTFLRNATDILGDTDKGLTTQQIIDKCNSFGYDLIFLRKRKKNQTRLFRRGN